VRLAGANAGQRNAIDRIMAAFADYKAKRAGDRLFFLEGPAGTGLNRDICSLKIYLSTKLISNHPPQLQYINHINHCSMFPGKTFTYNLVYDMVRKEGGTVMCCAFTGVAACLLPQGKTMHATFGLPVPVHDESVSWFQRHFQQ
jgi:hypothetical protein